MKPHLLVNKKQIGLIHVAKAHLVAEGVLDEEGYRDLLRQFRRFDGQPVTTSKDLVEAQADELLKYFQSLGWVYLPKARQAPQMSKAQRNKQIHLEAIQMTLTALGKDWAYAEGIARRMKYPRKLEWCSPEQLHQVYVALIYQERRDAGDPPAPREETLLKRKNRGQGSGARGQMEEIPF